MIAYCSSSYTNFRITDEDGEFLLIEAADHIPRWVDPDSAEKRVSLFIYFFLSLTCLTTCFDHVDGSVEFIIMT